MFALTQQIISQNCRPLADSGQSKLENDDDDGGDGSSGIGSDGGGGDNNNDDDVVFLDADDVDGDFKDGHRKTIIIYQMLIDGLMFLW